MIRFEKITPMLKSNDIRVTIDFYINVLQFNPETVWPAEEPTLCVLSYGGANLMFATSADWDSPGADPSMTGQLVFDVTDVCALHESICDKVKVLWGPEVYAYGRREFSIKDPNGYRLVFSEMTSDPVTCQG